MFHFRTYQPLEQDENGLNPMPQPEDIIDDSRTMGNGPFELLIGREFKLSVWDEIVKTMAVNEIARFTCPFQVSFKHDTKTTQHNKATINQWFVSCILTDPLPLLFNTKLSDQPLEKCLAQKPGKDWLQK